MSREIMRAANLPHEVGQVEPEIFESPETPAATKSIA